jgi:hypothetical protein
MKLNKESLQNYLTLQSSVLLAKFLCASAGCLSMMRPQLLQFEHVRLKSKHPYRRLRSQRFRGTQYAVFIASRGSVLEKKSLKES